MSKSITDRTLALAGLFQAVMLVTHVARKGVADSELFENTLESLFVVNPQTTLEVYGCVANVRDGLMLLRNQFGDVPEARDVEQARYAMSLINLERKLAKRPDLLQLISQGLKEADKQAEMWHVTHENVVAKLADIYLNTVSTLSPRIIVSGEHGHLQNTNNANKVRALLLAGMRSAVLWRQCGGSRLQLLFGRGSLMREVDALLR